VTSSWQIALAERGLLPLPLVRLGIRSLLRSRLTTIAGSDRDQFVQTLRASPIAIETGKANEQHYEVPTAIFENVLGPHRKYSCCYWPEGAQSLADAELASLEQVCERAQIHDGQRILDLGCGWGSFSLYAARRFPHAQVVAVSNSRSQATFINERRPPNLEVVTADMNDFEPSGAFDRVVSIEMFEHMRNYEELLRRIAGWLKPSGRLFVHVFCHHAHAYPFQTDGNDNWLGRHFFTGGLMPSLDMFRSFTADLTIEEQWSVGGIHYQRTAAAWRENLEERHAEVLSLLRGQYGTDAELWYHRWRLFFTACEELFGYRGGKEWLVGHYRFRHAAAVARGSQTQLAEAVESRIGSRVRRA